MEVYGQVFGRPRLATSVKPPHLRHRQTVRTCFFHIGMPKTGTTSIQSALFYQLSEPHLQYCSFGEVNGSRGMSTLFSETPGNFVWNKLLGLDDQSVAQYRKQLESRRNRAVRRARSRGADLVISAESGWNMTSSELARIKAWLNSEGYEVKVVAYLRPWMAWLPSILQEKIKNGLTDFAKVVDYDSLTGLLDYAGRMDRTVEVFGEDAVDWRKYDRRSLRSGCAVQDFFECIGAKGAPPQAPFENDSLGMEACKLLYHYNRHQFPATADSRWLAERSFLLGHLNTLRSEPLQMHRSLVEHIVPFVEEQQKHLLNRHGIDLPLGMENVAEGDAGIRSEEDLLSPLLSTLEWLTRSSCSGPLSCTSSAGRSHEIADRVGRIAKSRKAPDRLKAHYEKLRREWRHLTTRN
jgi:hypothetical protein